ncbi:RNA polymerase sigma factor [Nocardioides sp. 1609]|uniref:RNA polymerase sigma factor n=1 Tax=Nocardioides sp. 1609 TaxID=2508327 RepID=UPI00106FD699|nr:RNA polymerase sigma factor [Nocardioides sp. 1609]
MPPHPTDGVLWRRATAGDRESFGVLFDRHAEAVRSYCARRTGSLDAADDLVSIVFLEAWRRREEVELVDDLALPWLYGVARRTVQRRWRTAVRHRQALSRLPASMVEPDPADGVAARLDDERHLERVRVAMTELNAIDRDVILLCVWQGLDYASASVALGVPIGTVRSRLSRARGRLRDAVEPDPPGPPGPPADPAPLPLTVQEHR